MALRPRPARDERDRNCLTDTDSAGTATLLFQLGDARIDEASGIAVGIASPGVVYVQNDSGDSARFFALDARTGRTLATFTVPGARNVDWEDIAVAPDDRGVASLWIGDIGDNDSVRKEVTIYRVDEPRVDMTAGFRAATTGAPQVWRLRYPDGPADAESLAVAPAARPTSSPSRCSVPPASTRCHPGRTLPGCSPRAGSVRSGSI